MSYPECLEKLNKTGYFIEKDFYFITRCPFCGDSRKHLTNHGHLYIYKNTTFFKCYRCGESGNIRKLFLEYLKNDIITPEDFQIIMKYFEENSTYKLNKDIIIKDDMFLHLNKNKIIHGAKIKYLLDRFNLEKENKPECLLDMFNRFNIIFDLFEFFNNNKILTKKYEYLNDESYLSYLNENYIGFISKYKQRIILRAITNKPKYRYKVFMLPTKTYFTDIDFYSPNSLYHIYSSDKLIVAEGIFDILNFKLNDLFNSNIPRIAVLGKTRYLNLSKILYYVKSGKYKKLIVLLDKDLKSQHRHLKYIFNNIAYKIEFYVNAAGKDFGEKNIILQKL